MQRPDLEAIEARLEAATPAPWHEGYGDDAMCMNARYVTTQALSDRLDLDDADSGDVIALTLLQYPRYAAVKDKKWDENMALIAHAPADLRALLDYVRYLEEKVQDG